MQAVWNLTLDKPGKCPGWIIQKVSFAGNQVACDGTKVPLATDFWEAFPVAISEKNHIDACSHNRSRARNSNVTVTRLARFYCNTVRGVPTNPKGDNNWKPPSGMVGSGPGQGLIWQGRNAPPIWGQGPSNGETPGKSTCVISWNCCGGCPTNFTSTTSATPNMPGC